MQAFGLTVTGDDVVGLATGSPAGQDATVAVRRLPREEVERRAAWAVGRPPTLERRLEDGTLVVRLHDGVDDGVRVEAPGLGLHQISADGRKVLAAPPEDPWRWQRILFAMVLPVAATLQQVELLHASAVTVGGRTLALTGHAGAGKTTLALQLQVDGATFVTDDVLACTLAARGLTTHPGPRFANVAHDVAARYPPETLDRFGRLLGESDKLHLEPRDVAPGGPLAAVLLLRPHHGDGPSEAVRLQPDLATCASLTFVPLIDRPGRLAASLAIWQRLAADVPMYALTVPRGRSPRHTAERVRALVEDLPG